MKRFLASFMALIFLFFPFLGAEAQTQIGFAPFIVNKPFGGPITKIQACVSPPGLIIHVGPPVGGQYFFSQSTRLHLFYTIKPGVWVLGLAQPNPITCVGGSGGGGGFGIGTLVDAAGTISSGDTVISILENGLGSLTLGGIVGLVSTLFNLMGISIFKKPPTYGPAYPINDIGTTLITPNFSQPLLTPI